MDVFDMFHHGFVQRALLAGCFISVLCSTLGVFLVLRRLSLIGDGLAHVSFGSVALGLLLNTFPLYVAIPVTLASSLGILKLTQKARLYGDAAIAIVSSIGVSVGVLLASKAGGFNIDLFSYLFGNILSISTGEVWLSVLLSGLLVGLITVFYQEMLSVTFDEETAHTSGVNTAMINRVLVLMTALTVVLAMRVVGIMLITALLVLPPVTALQMSRGFRGTIVVSCASGVLSVVLGVLISFAADLPTGATIVLINFLFFLIAFTARTFRLRGA
jgi:zinc transport system permease protein